jgi:hypothetical protein
LGGAAAFSALPAALLSVELRLEERVFGFATDWFSGFCEERGWVLRRALLCFLPSAIAASPLGRCPASLSAPADEPAIVPLDTSAAPATGG